MQEAEKRIADWVKLNDPSQKLILSNLGLTELPKIPSNCQRLHCDNNQLTVLPELQTLEAKCTKDDKEGAQRLSYPNCQTLCCYNNQLTVLPELPNCRELFCGENKLTVLPELPNCRVLWCYYNQLTVLPELPNCQFLFTSNNKYLWISKQYARQHNKKETPNYTKYAKVIQRNYRRYIIRKYKLLDRYLLRDTITSVFYKLGHLKSESAIYFMS
jgi:Leucine-rich repeat (LRR) protein